MIYRTQEEIINLATKTGAGANASVSTDRLSDLRVAQFGTARRSEIVGYLNGKNWHDGWEAFLRSKSINNSKRTEEERGVFHKVGTY